jgi:hypothetical protein
MAKSPMKPKRNQPEVELVDDAWSKFERFIRDVAKAGPQHRPAKPKRVVPKERGCSERDD